MPVDYLSHACTRMFRRLSNIMYVCTLYRVSIVQIVVVVAGIEKFATTEFLDLNLLPQY